MRYLNSADEALKIRAHFSEPRGILGVSYATVRDYCESVDFLPKITPLDGDLKNAQRPWAVKTILSSVPVGARLLEIGGGEPIVSGFLSELGYDVTLVDPYDGFGNGPTEYDRYVKRFPHVKIVRDYLRPGLPRCVPASFDAIFSVSVLEHLFAEPLAACFHGIAEFLAPGGKSIHCFDFILQGNGHEHDLLTAGRIIERQAALAQQPATHETMAALLTRVGGDVETFYLSAQGHHHWRNGLPYDEFPFRKVVSIQTAIRKPQ